MHLSPHLALGAPIMTSVVVGASMLTAAANMNPLVTTKETFTMPTPTISAFPPPTPGGDFQLALAAVLRKDIEGGFVNDPRDPGGATNMGMSLREVRRLDADNKISVYLKDALDIDDDGDIDEDDVRLWARDHAETFYREFYWEPIGGSRLPHPIAVSVFDSAVNEGVQRAAKHLQRCVGVDADGIVGKKTIAAAWAWRIEPGGLRPEEEVFLSRLNRYATLNGASTFFAGWSKRAFKILKISQS